MGLIVHSFREKPRYRWYQYSLRSLLLMMVAVSIAMAFVANRLRKAERQRMAVAAIKKSGGWVQYAHDSSKRSADGAPPAPRWLRSLLGDDVFSTVVEANVASGADFRYLAQFGQLRRVRCCGAIAEARGPRGPDFPGSPPPGLPASAGIEYLAELMMIEDLGLGDTDIGDAELEHIGRMTKLRRLDVGGTKVTDDGLRHLERLTRLEQLDLSDTRIGNAGVERLVPLTKLKGLNLQGTRVNDVSLACLAGLKNLQHLDVRGTHVTQEGAAMIQKALPACNVVFRITISSPPSAWQDNHHIDLPSL
jgi:hypothetical protein